MIVQDDRNPEQLKTHSLIVVGTDSFMSGWGKAKHGASYAGWACTVEDVDRVERWVQSRPEMERVRIVSTPYRPKPGYCAHFHVYVVDGEHPARQ